MPHQGKTIMSHYHGPGTHLHAHVVPTPTHACTRGAQVHTKLPTHTPGLHLSGSGATGGGTHHFQVVGFRVNAAATQAHRVGAAGLL